MRKPGINIAGIKFGKLTAIALHHKKEHNKGNIHYWKFQCECGNIKVIKKASVTTYTTTHCGCIKYGKALDFIPEGSRLKFIKQITKASDKNGRHLMAKALYKCVCGNIQEIVIAKVKNGHTRSCGCLCADNKYIKHGFCNHPLYKTFFNIKKRCYETHNEAYIDYGARGVKICQQWLEDPISFVQWAIEQGWRRGLQVDKDIIPKKLGIPALLYSPEMCTIATIKENMNAKRNNRIIFFNGVSNNLCQWGEITGIKTATINARLKRGWSIEKTLTAPVISKYKK